MLYVIVFFNKCDAFELKKIAECFPGAQIMLPGKFINTGNSKSYFLFLFAHSKSPRFHKHFHLWQLKYTISEAIIKDSYPSHYGRFVNTPFSAFWLYFFLPFGSFRISNMLIGDKWKVLILRDLLPGTKRFGELKKSIGTVSQKVLTAQLRDMERNGLVTRKVYPEVPPRVEYSLTELGRSLKPILDAMWDWGEEFKAQNT